MKSLTALVSLLSLGLGLSACNSLSGVDDLHFGVLDAGTDAPQCTSPLDCPEATDECLSRSCVEGVCGFVVVPDGTPLATQTPGDCRIRRCKQGKPVESSDDSDIPPTLTDCDEELCTNGVPSNPPKNTGTECATVGGSVCDGAGSCVECNSGLDCSASTSECRLVSCHEHKCVEFFEPQGKLLSQQIAGDCLALVCDGQGGSILVPADADAEDDANDCTKDTCANGVSVHTVEPLGTPCGNNLACNDMGQCTGCTLDAQCNAPQTCGGGGDPGVCGCTPKTCQELGKTCGLWPDSCGGTLNCNDGVKNGAELGVDCGGDPACNKCLQGVVCASPTDCQSGFCVDGVCCDKPCAGECKACTAAKKGAGVDGLCESIQAGLDPDDECDPQAASTCGFTGVCSGLVGCAKYENGTVCGPASCSTSVFTAESSCQNGTCTKPASLDCSPHMCSIAGCDHTCSENADCLAGFYCEAMDCVPQKPIGASCTESAVCQSGHCVDGVCCGDACTGACMTCKLTGNVGKCSFVPQDSEDPDSCLAPKACSGAGKCLEDKGQACAQASDCASGHCVDGVCCDSGCSGTCRACNLPGSLGTCSYVPNGASDLGTCAAPRACDGAGLCKATQGQNCSGNSDCLNGTCVDHVCCNEACSGTCRACNLAGSIGTCADVPSGAPDADTCATPRSCDGMGACLGGVSGVACTQAGDCQSGFCVDGYCCDSACTGPCEGCSTQAKATGTNGVCGPVLAGTDPGNECAQTSEASCTTTGVCNGMGACQFYSSSTVCEAASCTSTTTLQPTNYCSGAGMCVASTPVDCSPFLCQNGACSTLCANDTDCASTAFCNGGQCQEHKQSGEPCGGPNECVSGFCVDAVCCVSDCPEICRACNVTGNKGYCTNIPVNETDDNPHCDMMNACDGSGMCKLATGSLCTSPDDCASGICVGFIEKVCLLPPP